MAKTTNKVPATTTSQNATAPKTFNPFKKRDNVNAGAVAVAESKAVTEAMGKLYVAKQFPRDEEAVFEEILAACRRPTLAEEAQFSYPRAGKTIKGPSIRLAEEMARCWGNIDYGIRELSQNDGNSEMEAFAWDLQKNAHTSQTFTVQHERDTNTGKKELTDNRDIYENNANMGSRRLRARILALIPVDIVDAAVAECEKTILGDVSNLPERVLKMLEAFKKFNVTDVMVEKRVGKQLSKMTAQDFSDTLSVYNSLKNGISKVSDWFEGAALPAAAEGTAIGDINAEIKKELV